jgi:dethiobiotin synthetase
MDEKEKHFVPLTAHDSRLTGVFIAGTDTGVGKTTVTAALAVQLQTRGRQVGIMKPIETGVSIDGTDRSDAGRLRTAVGCADALDLISPYRFIDPIAPLAAARRTGRTIELEAIKQAFDRLAHGSRLMLVEGVGGVLAPLSDRFDVGDLLRMLELPTILVSHASLGAVNHVLLALEALTQRNAPVLAVVLNRPTLMERFRPAAEQSQSTVDLLHELAGVPVFGSLPHIPMAGESWSETVHRLSLDAEISRLATLLLSSRL